MAPREMEKPFSTIVRIGIVVKYAKLDSCYPDNRPMPCEVGGVWCLLSPLELQNRLKLFLYELKIKLYFKSNLLIKWMNEIQRRLSHYTTQHHNNGMAFASRFDAER